MARKTRQRKTNGKARKRAGARAPSRSARPSRGKAAPCLLLTGFGPFPGAPFNPSGPLAQTLARTRRFSSAKLVGHVFPTSYRAVDRELPALIARHHPDALIMFGLAARSRHVRIETFARNAVSATADAEDFCPGPGVIGRGAGLAARAPGAALLQAARSRGLPARLSRDAGRYVCNYLFWRGLEAAAKPRGPRLAVFVHVPAVRRTPRPLARLRRRSFTQSDLLRSAEAIVAAALATIRINPAKSQ